MKDAIDTSVFAYSSNTDLADLRRWFMKHNYDVNGIHSDEYAVLPGHRLVRNYYSTGRRGGAANIEPQADRELPGGALQVDSSKRSLTSSALTRQAMCSIQPRPRSPSTRSSPTRF